MLQAVNPTDPLTAARLVEFLAPNTPWHRSLWNVGTVLTLRELIEATQAMRSGVLSEESVKALGNTAIRLAGKDPAVSEIQRTVLRNCLQHPPRYDGLDYHSLVQISEQIERDYLSRWAAALGNPNNPINPERAARCIASHLLDRGFSATWLHQWWKHRLFGSRGGVVLSDAVAAAHDELGRQDAKEFEVLIAFKRSPGSQSGYPREWLKANATVEWLRGHGFDTANVRPSGAYLLHISAFDPDAAAERAAESADHLTARASVATGEMIEVWPEIWVRGEPRSHARNRNTRGVRVRALYREDKVYTLSGNTPLDAAIDLLSHLESSSPSAAVAGGWAAIEALLSEPGDHRGAAADRLAYLVACSFPRAELTALSYVIAKTNGGTLADDLSQCAENRDRAMISARAVSSGADLGLRRQTDLAAVRRMQRVLRSPSKALDDIRGHIADALTRLYRQRNLVLHGGKTNAIALRASLRTSAKLVGAGLGNGVGSISPVFRMVWTFR